MILIACADLVSTALCTAATLCTAGQRPTTKSNKNTGVCVCLGWGWGGKCEKAPVTFLHILCRAESREAGKEGMWQVRG